MSEIEQAAGRPTIVQPGRLARFTLRFLSFVVLGGAIAGAGESPSIATESSSVSETATTVTSTTSSTEFIGPQFVHCTYDVAFPDGGSFGSMDLLASAFWEDSFWIGCDLLEPGLQPGATLEQLDDEPEFRLTGVTTDLPEGARLMRCREEAYISQDDSLWIGYTSFDVWGWSARSRGGVAMRPPRLCITNIDCDEAAPNISLMTEPMCGDSNYNLVLEARDALAALRTSIGTPSCRPVESTCDTNDDARVTASDALMILRAAIGHAVKLTCPPPCYPGTIGPPGMDREFRVVVSTAIKPTEDLYFSIVPTPSSGLTLSGSECEDLGSGGYWDTIVDGTVNGKVLYGNAFHPQPLIECYYRAIGDDFPDASNFQIVTKTAEGQVIDGAMQITSITVQDW